MITNNLCQGIWQQRGNGQNSLKIQTKLTKEEIGNLNSCIGIKEIESIV